MNKGLKFKHLEKLEYLEIFKVYLQKPCFKRRIKTNKF